MASAANLLQCLIPISQFNKGQAAKIFDRLHSEKELIVLKSAVSNYLIPGGIYKTDRNRRRLSALNRS